MVTRRTSRAFALLVALLFALQPLVASALGQQTRLIVVPYCTGLAPSHAASSDVGTGHQSGSHVVLEFGSHAAAVWEHGHAAPPVRGALFVPQVAQGDWLRVRDAAPIHTGDRRLPASRGPPEAAVSAA